ncbi:10919_t:CDS:1 [Scutellospora calospora]|uniref:10919_t:CDS:1 n=1 Tax=Scutellospora calospora TaxID=85575 RepID=A0ACA9LY02_9GLOM|nr:10919_t:CDS:1 [Scutellospora calospora]
MSYGYHKTAINGLGLVGSSQLRGPSVLRSKKQVNYTISNIEKSLLSGQNEFDVEIISFRPLMNLNEIFNYFENESNISRTNNIIKINYEAPSCGREKIAYYGSNCFTGADIVIKRFKEESGIDRYESAVLTTLVSQFLGNQFNNTETTSRKISFKNVHIVNYYDDLYFLESKLDYFEKFNDNNGVRFSDDRCKTLEAFTHFTYNYSSQQLVVSDLQGDLDTYELTDSAINSVYNLFGRTNLGTQGINNVINRHQCNSFCSKLNL